MIFFLELIFILELIFLLKLIFLLELIILLELIFLLEFIFLLEIISLLELISLLKLMKNLLKSPGEGQGAAAQEVRGEPRPVWPREHRHLRQRGQQQWLPLDLLLHPQSAGQ